MERKIPKNVRQIGNVSDTPKTYVEDYVDTFLNQLCDKADQEAIGAFLIGEKVQQEEADHIYIYGALQMQELEMRGSDIMIPETTWKRAYEECKEFFEDGEIVGWFITSPGLSLSLTSNMKKIHQKKFPEENSIFILKESAGKEEVYFAHKYNDLMQMGGHYIYYEKNPSMQNYMISMRKKIGVTPSEVVEDRAAKDFRNLIQNKIEQNEQRRTSRLIYVASTFLILVVLVIGITTINNYDRMQSVQDSLDVISRSVTGGEDGQENAQTTGGELVTATDGTASDTTVVSGDTEDGTSQSGDAAASDGTDAQSATTETGINDVERGNHITEEEMKKALEEDTYTVMKGDTLAKISMQTYGDTSHVEAICKMNGLEDGNMIYIGQKLLLP